MLWRLIVSKFVQFGNFFTSKDSFPKNLEVQSFLCQIDKSNLSDSSVWSILVKNLLKSSSQILYFISITFDIHRQSSEVSKTLEKFLLDCDSKSEMLSIINCRYLDSLQRIEIVINNNQMIRSTKMKARTDLIENKRKQGTLFSLSWKTKKIRN